jgi:Protein of unknown function (DUF3261)
MAKAALIAGTTAGLLACSIPGSRPATPAATTDIGNYLPVLTPAALGETHEVSQVLTARFNGELRRLRSVVSVSADRLEIILLSSAGLRLVSLTVDERGLTAQRTVNVPAVLDARQLLNDMQLVYWPLAELNSAWAGSTGKVTQLDVATRELWRAGQRVAIVRYSGNAWAAGVVLTHFAPDYQLQLDTSPADSQ